MQQVLIIGKNREGNINVKSMPNIENNPNIYYF